MTSLYIGGMAQGKRDLVQRLHELSPEEIADGAIHSLEQITCYPAVTHVHLLVRRLLEDGQDPLAALEQLDGKILICDEVGCGVVPLERYERDWREAVGRFCCAAARRAERVVRVQSGIPQVLKGRLPWHAFLQFCWALHWTRFWVTRFGFGILYARSAR